MRSSRRAGSVATKCLSSHQAGSALRNLLIMFMSLFWIFTAFHPCRHKRLTLCQKRGHTLINHTLQPTASR